MSKIYFRDNIEVLDLIESKTVDFIYIDPPFNTGKEQKLTSIKVTEDDIDGDRTGFAGKRYATEIVSQMSYFDNEETYLAKLHIRLEEAYRTLKDTGNIFIHLDHREVHYVKVMLDGLFGRDKYVESIYWTWDYGARTKKKFPQKTNEILWYCKDPEQYYFNLDECDRLPYMSPALVGQEKADRGKTPTNCFWLSIVGTNSHERTNYPTQKPVALLERLIKTCCPPEGLVLDFYAGSGTTGEAALNTGRDFLMCDNNPEAMNVMKKRFENKGVWFYENTNL